MANAILNLNFDYWNPSLRYHQITLRAEIVCRNRKCHKGLSVDLEGVIFFFVQRFHWRGLLWRRVILKFLTVSLCPPPPPTFLTTLMKTQSSNLIIWEYQLLIPDQVLLKYLILWDSHLLLLTTWSSRPSVPSSPQGAVPPSPWQSSSSDHCNIHHNFHNNTTLIYILCCCIGAILIMTSTIITITFKIIIEKPPLYKS